MPPFQGDDFIFRAQGSQALFCCVDGQRVVSFRLTQLKVSERLRNEPMLLMSRFYATKGNKAELSNLNSLLYFKDKKTTEALNPFSVVKLSDGKLMCIFDNCFIQNQFWVVWTSLSSLLCLLLIAAHNSRILLQYQVVIVKANIKGTRLFRILFCFLFNSYNLS